MFEILSRKKTAPRGDVRIRPRGFPVFFVSALQSAFKKAAIFSAITACP